MKYKIFNQNMGYLINLFKKTKINHKYVVLIFFIIFLFIGLSVYSDYGVSCDEWNEYERAEYTFDYLFNGNIELVDAYYGTTFGLPVYIIQKIFNITEINEVFLLRHLFTFLLFYISIFFFYLVGKKVFRNNWLALLGSLFLVLSPRIFAHSFYNSKDLTFLSLFIISIYSLLKYLDKKTLIRALIHAFICALLINIRIVGIFLPALTTLFIFFDFIYNRTRNKKEINNLVPSFILYVFLIIFFTVFFWPLLWENPIRNFIQGLNQMAYHPWFNNTLYLGEYMQAVHIPWHYIFVWIFVTTPILYILLFFVGLFSTINKLVNQPINFYLENRKELIAICWFFIPLLVVIILGSTLYDGWRQMFFIYPAFLIIAIKGLQFFYNFIKNKKRKNILLILVSLVIAVNLGSIINSMVKNHPYQNVYFNLVARKIFYPIKQNFELDYWGLSYRQGMQAILNYDKSNYIKVYINSYPQPLSLIFMPGYGYGRIKFVSNEDEADYLMSNYRWHKEEYFCENEIYKIEIKKEKILTVCKLK